MRKRILWVSILITFIGLIVFSFASTNIYYKNSVEHSKTYLQVYMNQYDESVTLDQAGAADLSEKLGGARVTFMKLDGSVIADSMQEALATNHADREEVDSAIKTGEGYSVRSSDTLGKNMVYYCKKFDNVLVRIAVFTSSEWTIYGQALPTVVWFLVVDALVCLIFTYLATNFIIKPIEELTKQAQNGDKITSKYEELQPIAELLNRQNENIKQKIERIEEEKSEVERAKESKDELVANITHEMNTPLTSIKGFSELLLGEGLSEEQRVRAVSIIREQSERLSNLIATVIHYSEIDSDDLPSYDVDFSALTKDTLKIFEPDFGEKNISVHTDIAEGVTVFSRQERLTTILTNLIANAIRYNKESGSITVGVSKINGNAVLKVSDTGIGISEENLDKIFSRFFTVDKSHNGKGGGYGLGLAFVKKLCLKSGWTISVESKLDEGTTFTVVF